MYETNEISICFDHEDLKKIILNHARALSGFSFDHVDIDIKKNEIRKIVCYSHVKPNLE